jgi:hypothetical protein
MSKVILDLCGETTDLYLRTRKLIHDAYEALYREKLKPWRFFYASPLKCMDCRGNLIQYSGVKYEGSPRLVFWSNFIEPCLEDIIVKVFESIAHICQQGNLHPDNYLNEASEFLTLLVRKVYEEMAETDQILRGQGRKESASRENVNGKVEQMRSLIKLHLKAIKRLQGNFNVQSKHIAVHKALKNK